MIYCNDTLQLPFDLSAHRMEEDSKSREHKDSELICICHLLI